MPVGKTLHILWDLSRDTATSNILMVSGAGVWPWSWPWSFFHPFIPPSFPSFTRDQHTARFGTVQGSGSAPIQKLFPGRFPGHHLRTVYSWLWRWLHIYQALEVDVILKPAPFQNAGWQENQTAKTVTQNRSNRWEKHELFFRVQVSCTVSRHERRQLPVVAGLLLRSGGYWDLWPPRQVRECVIVRQAVFSHRP